MATIYPDIIAEYQKNPGGWQEEAVLDGRIATWIGGPVVKMTPLAKASVLWACAQGGFPWRFSWHGPFSEGVGRKPFVYARRLDDSEHPGTNAWLEWSYAEEVPNAG